MSAIDELVGELARLPGIGRKTALRLAFHLLKAPEEEARKLSRAIQVVRERVRACTECGNLTEQSPCDICRSTRRDKLRRMTEGEPTLAAAVQAWDLELVD